MASTQSDDLPYPLKRNALASTRLNFNHLWMKGMAGYLLHPTIPKEQDNLRVADLGAGTGIWVSELAAALPNAKFDAVDISDDQFPPKSIRPPNVSWWRHNCFEPFHEEYLGTFDVVNARFWKCIVNDDVADKLFQNAITLLKPGGFLHWFEPLPKSAHVIAPDELGPTPACDKLVETWKKPTAQSSYDWINALPQTFERNGLEVVAEDQHRNPVYYQPIGAQTVLLGLAEYLYRDSSVERYQEELAKEHAEGAFVDVTWTCVVGRKNSVA